MVRLDHFLTRTKIFVTGPCLYGFTLDRAQEEAVLVHILYSHKKTRLLNILCTGYEYFKDSSVLYSDLLCFNMTVACGLVKQEV